MERELVRRVPARPLVWLGEKARSSDVAPLGARFPAYPAKERDFIFDPPRPPR